MRQHLLFAAAIVTMAVPVIIVLAWLYAMLAGIQSDDLTTAGTGSLGFIMGALANRAWAA